MAPQACVLSEPASCLLLGRKVWTISTQFTEDMTAKDGRKDALGESPFSSEMALVAYKVVTENLFHFFESISELVESGRGFEL